MFLKSVYILQDLTHLFILHVKIIVFDRMSCILDFILKSSEFKVLFRDEDFLKIACKFCKILNLNIDWNIVDNAFILFRIRFRLFHILNSINNFRLDYGVAAILRFEDNLLKELFIVFTKYPNPFTHLLF